MLESLELRRLLSAGTSYTLTTGVLTVTGGTSFDMINVSEGDGNVHLEYYDTAGQFQQVDLPGVTAININGGKKSDQIFYTGNSIGAKIFGGAGGSGFDEITVSDKGTGSSTVNGEAGNDTITVLQGNKTVVLGGDGNDVIEITDNGQSSVDAGKGNDYIKVVVANKTNITGGSGDDTILLNFDSLTNMGAHSAAEAFVLAGKGNDAIFIYDGTGTINGGDGKADIYYDESGGTQTFTIVNVEKTG
jgi:hypothetical protein